MLRYCQPGRPLSRANAQYKREEVATMLIVPQKVNTIRITTMVVAPGSDPTPARKISMNGYRVGDSRAASRFPRQKRRPTSIPRPRMPLTRTLVRIARGTVVEELLISSDI